MRLRFALICSVMGFALLPLRGQDTMRAVVKGNNTDHGKCTIEVNVDDVAEVEVSGDSARIRTLSGQPSQFRRFECNGIMPRRPADFRFQGIDGRGRVTLVRDPRDGGPAVVRIEDPKGGREGYTFDLEWQGGSSGYQGGNSGYSDRPGGYGSNRDRDRSQDRDQYQNRDRNGDDRRDYDRDRNGSGNSFTVSCSSDNGRRHYCGVDTKGGVRLIRETGGSACRQGDSWGYDSRGIWVDRGCRAEFEVRR
jgi:Protein of unknown function (DUF3011)